MSGILEVALGRWKDWFSFNNRQLTWQLEGGVLVRHTTIHILKSLSLFFRHLVLTQSALLLQFHDAARSLGDKQKRLEDKLATQQLPAIL